MHVLIISAVFPPETVMSAFTSANLAEELTRRGHDVVVLAPFPNRPSGHLYDGYFRRLWQVEQRGAYCPDRGRDSG
jgi:hypothetical protein